MALKAEIASGTVDISIDQDTDTLVVWRPIGAVRIPLENIVSAEVEGRTVTIVHEHSRRGKGCSAWSAQFSTQLVADTVARMLN